MNNHFEMNNVAKETIEVLKYFDLSFVSKISSNFLKHLQELAEKSDITVTIDKNLKLKDPKISSECKDLISMMYYEYIATEEEKKKIADIWKNNEILYQEKIKEKYNPDNIFKNKEVHKIDNIPGTNLPAVIKKESIVHRIKAFFKKLFTKNK